jgi:hypothetical protein
MAYLKAVSGSKAVGPPGCHLVQAVGSPLTDTLKSWFSSGPNRVAPLVFHI